jgi:hypothetical protein
MEPLNREDDSKKVAGQIGVGDDEREGETILFPVPPVATPEEIAAAREDVGFHGWLELD